MLNQSSIKPSKPLEITFSSVFWVLTILILGGPKVLPLRYVINIFKGATILWVIFLMYYFSTFCTGMWVYLFLHGTYGFAWLAKDIYFPDTTFMKKGIFGIVD